jgi:hypothetical protein
MPAGDTPVHVYPAPAAEWNFAVRAVNTRFDRVRGHQATASESACCSYCCVRTLFLQSAHSMP